MPDRAPRGPGLGKEGTLVADLLKLLLKIRARELNVAARLIARSDDLEALAAGARNGIQMMEGWRYDVFGHAALDLVERSEEHTSELQSLMRISYAVFCLKKTNHTHLKAHRTARPQWIHSACH